MVLLVCHSIDMAIFMLPIWIMLECKDSILTNSRETYDWSIFSFFYILDFNIFIQIKYNNNLHRLWCGKEHIRIIFVYSDFFPSIITHKMYKPKNYRIEKNTEPFLCHSSRENLCIFSVGSFQDTVRFLQGFAVFPKETTFSWEKCVATVWKDPNRIWIKDIGSCHVCYTGYWSETQKSWKECVATEQEDPVRIWSTV